MSCRQMVWNLFESTVSEDTCAEESFSFTVKAEYDTSPGLSYCGFAACALLLVMGVWSKDLLWANIQVLGDTLLYP